MITVTLPPPHKALRPNARTHWKARMKPKQAAKQRAYLETLAVLNGETPLWTACHCFINYLHPTKRHMDVDNIIASLKAYIDGVAEAGLLKDDQAIVGYTVKRMTAPVKDHACVILKFVNTEGN